MDTATIIRNVSREAELDEDAARTAITATLRTLGERINGDEARQLAAQLPIDLTGPLLESAAESPEGERFEIDEFVGRVGERLGADRPDAERAASAVLHVVGEAVEPAAWSDVLAQLPTTMDALFRGDRPSDHNG